METMSDRAINAVSSTISSYLRSLIGTYSPTGTDFAGADWEYIFSAIIFCIILYSILRIIGSLFK